MCEKEDVSLFRVRCQGQSLEQGQVQGQGQRRPLCLMLGVQCLAVSARHAMLTRLSALRAASVSSTTSGVFNVPLTLHQPTPVCNPDPCCPCCCEPY